ncbi:uncharacterized protein LOC142616340 [Castanea sativa]|uniref:uncharacterized protein LOC142616340 n=1 Tax=Castanea sativa TaxID=21020 RepID=UPI003F64A528
MSLKSWNTCTFGHVGKQVADLQRKLQMLESMKATGTDLEAIHATKVELNRWLGIEEKMWQQRSRNNWLRAGDKNTTFFHTKASNWWLEDVDQIGQTFVRYFEELFTTSRPKVEQEMIDAVQSKVNERMNTTLTQDFHAMEVEKALKQMHPLTAPSPDGMPPLFYHHFWPIVKSIVIITVLDFLNHDVSPPKFHDTHIVLIPKTKNLEKVSDYRPISLCNVAYKIASKVVANRMKLVLQEIIGENQSACIAERLITDNVLVEHELMSHVSKKKKGKCGEIAIKLDMSKAYDWVEWECLKQIMKKLGFHEKWISTVMRCVSSVKYAIRINGQPYGSIQPTRGLRQGDPLSPYLFLLCVKGLSALLNHAAQRNAIKGVAASANGPRISHLFFADDSLIFGRATENEAMEIQRILKVYETSSGQQLNYHKTSLFFSPNTDNGIRERVKIMFGAQVIKPHEAYLGLPSLVGRDAILGIPLSLSNIQDKLIWAENKSGKFTVKSAYALALEEKACVTRADCSDELARRKIWKAIWLLKVPQKIKHFAWKAGRGILATKSNLAKRKIVSDGTCELCGHYEETVCHFLWSCDHAKEVWNNSKFALPFEISTHWTFLDVVENLQRCDHFRPGQMEQFITVSWGIWKNRNDLQMGGKGKAGRTILRNALQLVEEFRSANEAKTEHQAEPVPLVSWQPPRQGYYKVNIDGAVFSDRKQARAGVLIRDGDGEVIIALSKKWKWSLGAIEAKAKALEAGVVFAKDVGIRDAEFESDSLLIFNALQGLGSPPSSVVTVLAGIMDQVSHFKRWKFTHTKRQGNVPAHLLAQQAKMLRIMLHG